MILDKYYFQGLVQSCYSQDAHGNKSGYCSCYQFTLIDKENDKSLITGDVDLQNDIEYSDTDIEDIGNEIKQILSSCDILSDEFINKYGVRFLKTGKKLASAIVIADNNKTSVFQTYPQQNKN